jgi:hypothetical protein
MSPNRGAVRNADAGEQNDEQGSGYADRGADEEISESLIQAHAEQYGADEGAKRGY